MSIPLFQIWEANNNENIRRAVVILQPIRAGCQDSACFPRQVTILDLKSPIWKEIFNLKSSQCISSLEWHTVTDTHTAFATCSLSSASLQTADVSRRALSPERCGELILYRGKQPCNSYNDCALVLTTECAPEFKYGVWSIFYLAMPSALSFKRWFRIQQSG